MAASEYRRPIASKREKESKRAKQNEIGNENKIIEVKSITWFNVGLTEADWSLAVLSRPVLSI